MFAFAVAGFHQLEAVDGGLVKPHVTVDVEGEQGVHMLEGGFLGIAQVPDEGARRADGVLEMFAAEAFQRMGFEMFG